MPELPEIESLKRTLEPRIVGRRIARAVLHRADFAQTHTHTIPDAAEMLQGDTIDRTDRLGKQLAIIGTSGRVMCVQLGMSGQLLHIPAGSAPEKTDHINVRWQLDDGSEILFRDPRRFGSLTLFPDTDTLFTSRWNKLGPDALTVTRSELREALSRSSRAIKTALLDQHALAGVGNIYADEALFRARVHPLAPCSRLDPEQWRLLAGAVRQILREAIAHGGSTLRDYRNADGASGKFQSRHQVYGRAGEPCRARGPKGRGTCGGRIERQIVSQRSTHWCPRCQRPQR